MNLGEDENEGKSCWSKSNIKFKNKKYARSNAFFEQCSDLMDKEFVDLVKYRHNRDAASLLSETKAKT